MLKSAGFIVHEEPIFHNSSHHGCSLMEDIDFIPESQSAEIIASYTTKLDLVSVIPGTTYHMYTALDMQRSISHLLLVSEAHSNASSMAGLVFSYPWVTGNRLD